MCNLGMEKALFLLFVLCSVVVSVPVVVEAEAGTVVVPDDFVSVQEAVDNAADGDVVLVKCGTYNGSVAIDKQIMLIGEDKTGTVIQGDWSLGGTVVLVEHDDVVVEKLTLKAAYDAGPHGRGVHLLNVKGCNVSDCNFVSSVGVWLYDASGSTVENNHVDGTKAGMPPVAGIKLQHSEDNRIVGNSVIEYKYGVGISLESSDRNILAENQLSNNYNGIWLKDSNSNSVTDNEVTVTLDVFLSLADNVMLGCYGIGLQQSSNNSVAGNSFVDCPKGVRILSTSCYNTVENNVISGSHYVGVELAEDSNHNQIIANNLVDNGVGAKLVNASNNAVHHNNFINNSVLISSRSEDEPNFFDDGAEGNYWSNYNGTDGDGVGDTPYIIDENNQDNHPLMNKIPEFPPWTIIPLFLTATLFGVIAKKKYSKGNTHRTTKIACNSNHTET
ncbi:MAG: NosD domain-containing protein [Candidatus Bathyarchaeota archaeon]